MSVKLLTQQHLEFMSLKGGCTGSSESTLVKMPHCWQSCVAAHMLLYGHGYNGVVINENFATTLPQKHANDLSISILTSLCFNYLFGYLMTSILIKLPIRSSSHLIFNMRKQQFKQTVPYLGMYNTQFFLSRNLQ